MQLTSTVMTTHSDSTNESDSMNKQLYDHLSGKNPINVSAHDAIGLRQDL
jgi:hypothetical protein